MPFELSGDLGADSAELSPEERVAWRKYARSQNLIPADPIRWEPPTPTPAEWLEECARVPRPAEPAPDAGPEEVFCFSRAMDWWERQEKERCLKLASLGGAEGHIALQRRSQLVADLRWNDPTEPYHDCQVRAVGRKLESGIPRQAIRGKSITEAGDRYLELVGVTGGRAGLDPQGQELVVVLMQAPAPAA
jgi:hypothetical protein